MDKQKKIMLEQAKKIVECHICGAECDSSTAIGAFRCWNCESIVGGD
jgi:ribosomal protein L37AE/L43A